MIAEGGGSRVSLLFGGWGKKSDGRVKCYETGDFADGGMDYGYKIVFGWPSGVQWRWWHAYTRPSRCSSTPDSPSH